MGILERIRRKKSDAARRSVSRMKDKEETSDSCADGACVWFDERDGTVATSHTSTALVGSIRITRLNIRLAH